MNIHDLIFLLIKNVAYLIFFIIFFFLIAGIAKFISIPLIVVSIILSPSIFIAVGWMGYLNTKDLKDEKFKTGLIYHLILVTLTSTLSLFYDDQTPWKQVLDSVVFFVVLEIGSIIYYFKNRRTQFDEYVEHLKIV